MKRFILLLTTAILLSGCSAPSNTPEIAVQTTLEQTTTVEQTTAKSTAASEPETTTIIETTVAETHVPEKTIEEVKVSELFESVYIPYAKREKAFTFDGVKKFVESTSYKVDIVEPTADEVGKITVTDENGDYIFFVFNDVNGVETIMVVSFYQALTNSEVSMDNFSSGGSPEYDQYSTHIIGSDQSEVNGPDAQRKFLFK